MSKSGETKAVRPWRPGEETAAGRAGRIPAELGPPLTRFARGYSQALRRAAGLDVAATAVGWRLQPFKDVLAALPKDGVLNVLRADGLKSPALLVMAAPLLGGVTEVMLGGGRDGRGGAGSSPSASGHSPVTRRLARRLATLANEEWGKALGELCPGGLRLTRQETEPLLATIMADDEAALIADVRLVIFGESHLLSLVVPAAALVRQLAAHAETSKGLVEGVAMAAAPEVVAGLVAAPVELVARFGEVTITTKDLLHLAVGDLLLLDSDLGPNAVEVLVEGVAKLRGEATVSRGSRAFRFVARKQGSGAA